MRNGGYIVIETDWSCFINPWSKKLEFVIGKHTVKKGPPRPDVFAPDGDNDNGDEDDDIGMDEGLITESKSIQKDIRLMLTETIRRPTTSNLLLGPKTHPQAKRWPNMFGSKRPKKPTCRK